MDQAQKRRLSLLPTDLGERYAGPIPDYRSLYTDAVNRRFPAVWSNGRWYFRQADLPAIAAALGLRAKPQQVSRRKAAQQPVATAA